MNAIGTVYLPREPGTAVGQFQFLVDPDGGRLVEIGTPVAAETPEGTLIGTVIDLRTVGVWTDPVEANCASDEQLGRLPEALVARVQVFDAPALRPVVGGVVRAATAEEMLRATGHARMDWHIPAGVVELADGRLVPVSFDGHALLGPESAHLTIGGLSGQAAKTSYAGVLLRSALAAGRSGERSVAALVFNVKGEDLLWLDEPPAAGYEFSDEDRAIYAALGVPAEPFEDVTVYAPTLGIGTIGSARTDAKPLRWGLPEVWEYLQYLYEDWYDDEKISGFAHQFYDLRLTARNPADRIDTIDDIIAFFDGELRRAEEENRSEAWGGRVHVATMRKLRRRFLQLGARCRGLVAKGAGDRSDVPDTGWVHGQVVVVDIAGLMPDVQALIIARTVNRLTRAAEAGSLGVDHLVVFADELNTFAPAQGGEMHRVRRTLQRIATQGRYAGISLWGAAQKLSKVDELIRDNAASRALGICADAELSSSVYGSLPGGLAERIATLPKGRMVLWHYAFRSALIVRFPRPAWRTGRARTARRPDALTALGAAAHLTPGALERLTEGLHPDEVTEVVGTAADAERAVAELERRRVPDPRRSDLYEPPDLRDDPFGID